MCTFFFLILFFENWKLEQHKCLIVELLCQSLNKYLHMMIKTFLWIECAQNTVQMIKINQYKSFFRLWIMYLSQKIVYIIHFAIAVWISL